MNIGPNSFVLFMVVSVLCLESSSSTKIKAPVHATKQEVDESDLTCAACLGLVDVVHKAMKKPGARENVESTVLDVMENICVEKNFNGYDFSPRAMTETCLKLFEDYHDAMEISRIFTEQYKQKKLSKDLVERAVCLKQIPICVGSERMKSNIKIKKGSVPQKDLTEKDVEDLMIKHKDKLRMAKPVKMREEL